MIGDILLNVMMGMLLLAAIFTVVAERLMRAAFLAGVFSALAAFVYLLLGAPDVALAEAVIGSTLSTVIYLVAIKRCRIFTICCVERADGLSKALRKTLAILDRALKDHEIEPHLIQVSEAPSPAAYDLLVEAGSSKVLIRGERHSQYVEDIHRLLQKNKLDTLVTILDKEEGTDARGET